MMTAADTHSPRWPKDDNLHSRNWLLCGLILISMGIHLLVLMHMAHLYRSRDISRIELTLKQISARPQREIPRPRLKPLAPQERTLAETFDESEIPIKPFQPALPVPVDPDRLAAEHQLPQIPVIEDSGIAEWHDDPEIFPAAVPSDGIDPVMTESAYTRLIQKKIEAIAIKRYPARARRRNAQGIVEIEFTIAMNGDVSHISIVRSSGERDLDRAAIGAAMEASPFAAPPNGPMTIRLPISYRLI